MNKYFSSATTTRYLKNVQIQKYKITEKWLSRELAYFIIIIIYKKKNNFYKY